MKTTPRLLPFICVRRPSGCPLAGGWRRSLAISAATALLCGCGTVPSSDVSLGQTVIEMADAINGLQEESALMQAQLDSLREVVARQDTVVRRIASMAGVPVPAP